MTAKDGDRVAVHYTGRLDNGEVFDTSEGRDPIEFTLGKGEVIPGFENAVRGLEEGESKNVRIPPEEAYGERDPDAVIELDRGMFGDHPVEVGQHLDLEDEDGNTVHADVVKVSEDTVTVDTNPHLAGETLTFELKLVGIKGA